MRVEKKTVQFRIKNYFIIFLEEASEETFTRIALLEEKTRSQEVEIILLKSALSDVLTQLAALNNQQQKAATNGSVRTTTRKSGKKKIMLLYLLFMLTSYFSCLSV